MEIFRLWFSDDDFIWIGVHDGVCIATRSETKLVLFCQKMGLGIPVDLNIKDFSKSGFVEFAVNHPVLRTIENWDILKPKLNQ